MAMKKKFLGLAMAAMVAVPATSAYAAPVVTPVDDATQKLEMDVNNTGEVTVPVTGTVQTKDGQQPQRIEVVLPSKLAFTVDKDGNFIDTNCEIENKSNNVDINISVHSFNGGSPVENGSGDGIQLLTKDEFDGKGGRDHIYRNQIRLSLSKVGKSGSQDPGDAVDLGKCNSLAPDAKKLGTLKAGNKTTLQLTGEAGTKDSGEAGLADGEDVDSKGAKENFNLVFSITKK